jgi:hypothetical protein
MEATNKPAAIRVVGIKVEAIKVATVKAAAVMEDAALARATLRSIVGLMAAAGIPAPPVCPSKMVIRTLPHLPTKWAAAPTIVRCDILGPINHLNQPVNDYPSLSNDPPKTSTILAKADSGASSHYFRKADQNVLSNLRATPAGPTVMLPDSSHVQATQSGILPLHHSLSTTAKTARVLDEMTNSSLISIGQLCDDDCVAILDKQRLQEFKNNRCILMGPRNKTDVLWDIVLPLPTPSATPVEATPVAARANLQINAIIRKDTSKMQLITYISMDVDVVLRLLHGKRQSKMETL